MKTNSDLRSRAEHIMRLMDQRDTNLLPCVPTNQTEEN